MSARQEILFRWKLVLSVCVLISIVFIAVNGEWMISRGLWCILRLPVPPASAWYMVEVSNATTEELLVEVRLINDRKFRVYGSIGEHTRRRLGKAGAKSKILDVGCSHVFDIPSEVEPRLGLFMVLGMSGIKDAGAGAPTQRIGVRVCSWHLVDESDKDMNRIRVEFRDQDMVSLTIDEVKEWRGASLVSAEPEGGLAFRNNQ